MHPWPLLAVTLMIFNDHFFKVAFGSWWTGKLSDFAGIFFFPVFLCALYCLVRNLAKRSGEPFFWITARRLTVFIIVTDLVFLGIKVWPEFRGLYVYALSGIGLKAAVVADFTDLSAFLMNPLTFWHGRAFFNKV